MKTIYQKQISHILAMLNINSKRILVLKIIRIKTNEALDLTFLYGDEIWT
jgi:hypothetical protein